MTILTIAPLLICNI